MSDIRTTPPGLLNHLAYIMGKLDKGEISIDEAKAQAGLVKQSNNLLRYQLDVKKFEFKQKTFDV